MKSRTVVAISIGIFLIIVQLMQSCKKETVTVVITDIEKQLEYIAPPAMDIIVPDGFPPIEVPDDNPFSEAGIQLGRNLFYDNNLRCTSCHQQIQSFTITGNIPVTVNGKSYQRNPMPFVNLAWVQGFAWDGRSLTLEEKIIESIVESVGIPYETLITNLQSSTQADYDKLFTSAFGSNEITSIKINKALAQFLRTMIAANSPAQKHLRGELTALSQLEQDGFDIFTSETGNCSHCHLHSNQLFTDNTFRNNGIDSVNNVSDFSDYGHGEVTGVDFDNGKFRSVTLVNIALTAPYMHDSRFQTLEEVIEHYNTGGKFSPNVDNVINESGNGLNLTQYQKDALLAYLESMTDISFIADTSFSTPF